MTTTDMQAAFESWMRSRSIITHQLDKTAEGEYINLATASNWVTWRAALASRPDAQADEPVAYEFQHDETGRTTFVDPWQVEQGFASNNPRWQLIGPVFRYALASRPDAQADERGAFTSALILAICELPDRTSPEDDPGAMVANADEIASCVESVCENADLRIVRVAAPQAEAAQGVPSAADLQGLRGRLLASRPIVRDEDGWLHHPAYPICDEGTQADKLLEALGIEAAFVGMESDAPNLAERWHEEGMTDCSEWTPTPPAGNDWLLLEIYDTEDGPYAMFGRDAYAAEQERKKEHTRKLRAIEDTVRAERAAAPSPDREQVTERCQYCDGTGDVHDFAGVWLGECLECKADASPSRECGEPIAWESTTPGYTKYITDERYQKLRPEYRKWYKPYRCRRCDKAASAPTLINEPPTARVDAAMDRARFLYGHGVTRSSIIELWKILAPQAAEPKGR